MDPTAFEVLLRLDYGSIMNACRVIPEYFRVCRMPYFWEQKALLDFDILPRDFKKVEARDNKARYEVLNSLVPLNGMRYAAGLGSLELFNYFLEEGKRYITIDDYNESLFFAVEGQNENIIDRLIGLGVDDYTHALSYAAKVGNERLVDKFILLGGDPTYDKALYSAAENGDERIVNKLLALGNDAYDDGFDGAMESGNERLINKFLSLGGGDVETGLLRAVNLGKERLVDKFVNLGARNYNEALIEAARNRNERMVDKMISLGANNFKEAFNVAAWTWNGHQGIIDKLRNLISVRVSNLRRSRDY